MASVSNIRRAGWIAGGTLALLSSGCGEIVSWDDTWLLDGDDGSSASSSGEPLLPSSGEPVDSPAQEGCEATPILGYHYADAPEFWLGSQAALGLRVRGPGYLVAGPASGGAGEWRYARAGQLSVAPDGTLELGRGEPALGYAPGSVLAGSCLVALRAPVISAPQPTARIQLRMNFEPPTWFTIFDILDPAHTADASTSLVVFDSLGSPHVLHLYFTSVDPQLIAYYVVADGADLEGGTPGNPVLLSTGTLEFDTLGALMLATTPPLAVSFRGGPTSNQAIALGWGRDIVNDAASGYEGSRMFAGPTVVYSQSVDGFPAGTATAIDVDAGGHVVVAFDSGAALDIGALALARFPTEDALASVGPVSWVWTPESGVPQFAAPEYAGRGALSVSPSR